MPTPDQLLLAVQLVNLMLNEVPQVRAAVAGALAKKSVTSQEWLDLRAQIEANKFETLAPNAAANLPK